MAKKQIRILCLDPGTTTTGWCLLLYNTETGNSVIDKYGEFYPSKNTTHVAMREECNFYGKRLMTLCELEMMLKEIVESYSPDYVAGEDIYFDRNKPVAFIALCQWYTTVELLLKKYHKPVYRIQTKKAKKEIFGSGDAGKVEVQAAVFSNGRLSFKTKPPKEISEHEADAIAVGVGFVNGMLQTFLINDP